MNLRPSSDAWDLEGIEGLVEHPSIRLFRSPNAAMILTFLHRAFKEHEDIAIPESRLRARLDNYLEEIREQLDRTRFRGPRPSISLTGAAATNSFFVNYIATPRTSRPSSLPRHRSGHFSGWRTYRRGPSLPRSRDWSSSSGSSKRFCCFPRPTLIAGSPRWKRSSSRCRYKSTRFAPRGRRKPSAQSS